MWGQFYVQKFVTNNKNLLTDLRNPSSKFCRFEMLVLEQQHEIANQIGTTRSQIVSNLNDLALGTSFL